MAKGEPKIRTQKVARQEGKQVAKAIKTLANCPPETDQRLLAKIASNRLIEAVKKVQRYNQS